jgi:hypothetical protein
MESLCAAMLLVLSLCGPARAAPDAGGPVAALPVVRFSPSTDLLGRQLAVAPSTRANQPWGDPGRLAYCAPDGIRRSVDGGQTWTSVPTDGVTALAQGTDMPLAVPVGSAPVCRSVVLDPREPDAFYAVFGAVKPPQDAPPPWFAAGYVTRDAGQSWQPVPTPTDTDGLQFRGFVADEVGVQALFAPSPTGSTGPGGQTNDVAPPIVMATTNAGQTWDPVPFTCPASGACIRWGAPPTSIGSCAMHGYGQPLLVSDDDGQSWKAPTGARVANACTANELVTISDNEVLLLAPGPDELDPGTVPIRVSHDGGKTFAPAPMLPPTPAPQDLFLLTLLPDDRLLARVSGQTPGPGWTWVLLWHDDSPPAQDRWCAVADPAPLPTNGAPLRLAGDRVWWLGEGGQPASLAIADLRCGNVAAPRAGP